MNNQMPNYMPPFNMDINNDFKRIDDLEKRIKKLEKKVEIIENNKVYPMPFNFPNFPNNYMM